MMPRRSHPGRPGTRVIPAGWEDHHAPVAERTMVGARCQITRSGGAAVWNPDTNTATPPARVMLYADLPCRVQRLATGQTARVTADQQVVVGDYLVAVPRRAYGLRVGDRVTVTTATDPDLIAPGRHLTVAGVVRGSLRWERDLICTITD